MPAAKKPENEVSRLNALHMLEILDTEAEVELDALVKAAALVCDVPISLISLIDADRQWFKANVGLAGVTETPRELAFCAHAIHGNEILEVEDATQDVRFLDNPLVTQHPNICFYAGAPLTLSGGENVGTLCVIDSKPHHLSSMQREVLSHLATAVVKALETHHVRKSEEKLTEEAVHITSMVQHSKDAIIALTVDGIITHWNKAAEQLFGYTAINTIGLSMNRMVPQDKMSESQSISTLLHDKPEGRHYETVRLHRNGEEIAVSVSLSPTYDAHGKLIGATKIVRDIREQMLTAKTLAYNEERIRKLYQSTPAMLQSIDPQGRLISVSDYWLEKHGYTRDEVIGRPTTDFMTSASAKHALETVLPHVMAGGDCKNVAYQKVKKSGEIFDVLLSSILECDANGKPVRSIAVLVDVTEENIAKRATDELLGAIRTQFIMSMTDANGTIIEVNDAFCKISQYSREQLIGKNHRLVNSGFHPKHFFSEMWKTITTGQSWRGEVCNRAKDGSIYWVDSVISPIHGVDGKVVRYISIRSDISQRKAAESVVIEQKQQIQQIIESQSVATFMIDAQHRVMHWNHACEALTGIAANTMIGKAESWRGFYTEARPCLADLVLDKQKNQAGQYYPSHGQSALASTGWHAESWFENVGGNRRYLIFDAVPIIDRYGQITAVTETLQDVTDSKIAEQTLAEERQYLASVIEGTGAGTWQWNVATGQCRFNEQWAAMLGYTLEELGTQLFETWANLAHPEDVAQSVEAINKHFAGQTSLYEAEFRMHHRDGHWVWIQSRGRVLTWTEDDKPEWMYGTHADITERKHQEKAIKDANERIAVATQSGGIGIWTYDVADNIVTCDSTLFKLYGLPNTMSGTDMDVTLWLSLLHPDDRASTQQAFEDAIAGKCEYDTEFRAIWADGSVHHIRAAATTTRDVQGHALHMLGTNWDITPLRQLATELAEQHEMLRITLQSIGDAVITTDAAGHVTWFNPAAERITGWLTAEAMQRPLVQVFNIIHAETRKPAENPVLACLKQGTVTGLANHTVLISRNGTEYGIEDSAAPILDANGKLLGVVLVFHDVTEQRRLSGEMSYRATHDPLTGLVNRAEFENRLTRIFEHVRDHDSEHALMFIDLDQFKLVNDACGHSAGDLLLQQISKLLREIVRSRDTLARLGGDEFAVILEQCTIEQAQRVAQAICDHMDDFRFLHDGKRFRIGTSIGLAPLDNRWNNADHAMQAADTACYAAKEAGRNRVHTWFDTDLSMRTRQGETQWATRLEQAMDENQFMLYAQRIVAIDANPYASQQSIHAEVLLRLKDSNGEIIPPNAFLPAAERFHLASRIDLWVLQHAIQWMQALEDITYLDTLCINLSGQSIGDRAFHRQAFDILSQSGDTMCKRICLEITETATVTNMVDASLFIEQVRALGVRIALDDFGAGASSFGYLKTLKVDILKIDGQYIKDIIDNPLDDSAVRCFVDVANVMGIKTVAEYVETAAILSHISGLGVDYAQGFLLHKPAPIESLTQVILSS